MPRIKRWSLTSLQQRLVKTWGRLVDARQVLLPPAGRRTSDADRLYGADVEEDLGASGHAGRAGRIACPTRPPGDRSETSLRALSAAAP